MGHEQRRSTRRARDDLGLTDIISNFLLVAITVVMAAGLGYLVAFQVEADSPLQSSVSLESGTGSLQLSHRGGDPIPIERTNVLLTYADGSRETRPLTDFSVRTPTGATGNPDLWEFGERVCLVDPAGTCPLTGKTVTGASIVAAPEGGDATELAAWTGSVDGSGVPPPNQAPTSSFTYAPSDPDPGTLITFDASTSNDPDGTITSYEWDLDDDGTWESTGLTATHAFASEGAYVVKLRVTDDEGATDTSSDTVNVGNQPPTAAFTFSPSSPTVGQVVTFDGSGSTDSDGTIATYAWDWDNDGTTDETGTPASNSFLSTGAHIVTLTVTDDEGATDTEQKTVNVQAAPPSYVTCPMVAVSGTVDDCSAAQAASDSAFATLTEADTDPKGGQGNIEYNLEVQATLTADVGDALELRYTTAGETFHVEAWNVTATAWQARGATLDASSPATWSYTLTTHDVASGTGEVLIRFVDDTPNDKDHQSSLALDYVRIASP